MMHDVKDPPLQASINNLWHENNSLLKLPVISFPSVSRFCFRNLPVRVCKKKTFLCVYFLIDPASGETSYGKYFVEINNLNPGPAKIHRKEEKGRKTSSVTKGIFPSASQKHQACGNIL